MASASCEEQLARTNAQAADAACAIYDGLTLDLCVYIEPGQDGALLPPQFEHFCSFETGDTPGAMSDQTAPLATCHLSHKQTTISGDEEGERGKKGEIA